jgi:hypothetical protein
MPKCAIVNCELARDPDGGELCVKHQPWTAPLMVEFCQAVETAVISEDGLDGSVAERLLRAVGYYTGRPTPRS